MDSELYKSSRCDTWDLKSDSLLEDGVQPHSTPTLDLHPEAYLQLIQVINLQDFQGIVCKIC